MSVAWPDPLGVRALLRAERAALAVDAAAHLLAADQLAGRMLMIDAALDRMAQPALTCEDLSIPHE